MFEDKIGFMASLGFSQMPPAEVARSLHAIGYRAVEWTLAHFNPRNKSLKELQELTDITRDAGLVFSELVIQQDYVCLDDAAREDRIRFSIECIEACAAAGAGVVNLFTGPAPWDPAAPRIGAAVSHGTAWQMVCDAFDRLLPVLERCQVQGAVEGVWGHLCNDYFTTRLLIDRYRSPWLGVNFDPSHDVLKGNLDTGMLVREWGKDNIKHVHLKDAAGIQEEGRFLFPFLGEGNVDWRGMLHALKEIGYDGYLSVEFESFAYHERVLRGDTATAARRCFEDMNALLRDAGV